MIKITFRKFALLSLLCASPAFAGTVTGNLQTPNGLPIKNGTLNFTLAQAGLIVGTGAVVPSSVACYTSTDGTVVGVPNPLAIPQGSVNSSSGTLPAGTYYVQETLYNGTGESLPSPELTISVPSGGTLTINAISNFPATATGMRVYVGSTSGSETLQGSVTSGNYSLSVPLVVGTARPTSNSSTCQIAFNDIIIPYTGYKVSLLGASGGAYPGWPQQWQLNGGTAGTVNVSQGAPLWDGTVVYPTPILATPLNHGPQSISGPLDFGGYNITGIGSLSAQNGTFGVGLLSAVDNGHINPVLYPGNDLGQRITNAMAANPDLCVPGNDSTNLSHPSCTIEVPPGQYNISSGEIYIPPTSANFQMIMYGATLTFIGPNVRVGLEMGTHSHFKVSGGLIDMRQATNAVAGVVVDAGIQGYFFEDVYEIGATQGDGFLNLGANVGSVIDCTFTGNLIGLHLLGSPGYASNNGKFIGNILTGNARSGLIDGDVSIYPAGWPVANGAVTTVPGVSTPNYNNLFIGNDLEVNGSASTSSTSFYPAAYISLTTGDVLDGNYFEATPYNQITLGGPSTTDSAYTFMYGAGTTGANGGTAVGAQILNNYFTTSGGQEINLYGAYRPTITGNTDNQVVPNTCFIDVTQAATAGFYNNNAWQATSQYCLGSAQLTPAGFSQYTAPDVIDLDVATQGDSYFFNAQAAVTNYGVAGQFIRMTKGGPMVPSNPNNPGGNAHCDPAYSAGALWMDTCNLGDTGCTTGGGTMWLCVDDTRLSTPISDGHRTWVQK